MTYKTIEMITLTVTCFQHTGKIILKLGLNFIKAQKA